MSCGFYSQLKPCSAAPLQGGYWPIFSFSRSNKTASWFLALGDPGDTAQRERLRCNSTVFNIHIIGKKDRVDQ